MLYCGFDLSLSSFRALILSSGFALLDSKCFSLQPLPSLSQWIDPFRLNKNEPCFYFFDSWQFNNSSYARKLFLPVAEPDKIYLLPHRHLLEMLEFIKSLRYSDHSFSDMEYLTASFLRIFDLNMAKQPDETTIHLSDPSL